jgi:hypothetical protein
MENGMTFEDQEINGWLKASAKEFKIHFHGHGRMREKSKGIARGFRERSISREYEIHIDLRVHDSECLSLNGLCRTCGKFGE